MLEANGSIAQGDNEKFLSFCTEDIKYKFVGDKTLKGKEAVRAYMKAAFVEPPKYEVEKLIAESDFVTAIGKISMRNERGKMIDYSYCDVCRFHNGKIAEVKVFVIEIPSR